MTNGVTSIEEATVSMALDAGFAMPEQVGTPTLPPDVTVVSGNELLSIMVGLTAVMAYAETENAKAYATAEAKKAKYKNYRAQRYVMLKDDSSLTEKQRDYMLDADEELDTIKKEQILAESYAKMVQALLSGFEGKYQVLSRELTRRGIAAGPKFD